MRKNSYGVLVAVTLLVLALLTFVFAVGGKKALDYVKGQDSKISSLESEAGGLQADIEAKLAEIDTLKESLDDALEQIQTLNNVYGAQSSTLEDLQNQIGSLSSDIDDLEREIAELNKKIVNLEKGATSTETSDDNKKESEDKKKEESSSKGVYQKLANGEKVKVLIVGDSIAEPMEEDSWAVLLRNWITSNYKSECEVKNVSLSGNTSYAGYFRTMMLSDSQKFDLAIICYGQNDFAYSFKNNYELIVRAIQQKYPNCVIIPILESSQREYTEKMVDIQDIAEYYDLDVADTINTFNHCGMDFEAVCPDSVHPNTEGKKLYFNTIKDVIEPKVEKKEAYVYAERVALFQAWKDYDNFTYIKKSEMTKINDYTYEITGVKISGLVGAYFDVTPGLGGFTVYTDNAEFADVEKNSQANFNFGFAQLVSTNWCKANDSLKIVFRRVEDAEAFHGIGISK